LETFVPPLPWKRFLLSGLVAAAAYFLTPRSIAGTLIYAGIALAAIGAVIAGIRRYQPPRPWTWRCLAIGLTFFAAGDFAFALAERATSRTPSPSAADVLYVIGYPFLAAGLFAMMPRRRRGVDPGEAIDAAILVVGVGVLLWIGVIGPMGARVASDPWTLRFALIYPLADLVLLVIAAGLALDRFPRAPAAWLLLLGMAAQLGADLLFAPAQVSRSYHSGNPIDLGWLAAYLAVGAAALHPSMRTLADGAPPDYAGMTRRRFAILASTAIVAPALLLLDRLVGLGGAAEAIAVASSVLFVLAMLRLGQLALALDAALAQSRSMRVALGRERDLLQTVLEQLPDAVYIKDADSRFVRLNSAAARTLGVCEQDDALGKTDFDFFPAELATQYFTDEQQVIAAGQPVLNKLEPQSLDLDHASWWLTSTVPWRDERGAVIGIIGVGRDVTDRRRLEEDLRQSEERFRAAFTGAPIGMALIAPDGRTLQVNRALCEMLGYSEAELLATTLRDLTLTTDVPANRDLADRALAGELSSYRLEKGYRHKDGRVVWALLSASLVRDGDGSPRYFVSQIEDISERRRSAEALRDSEARLRALLNAVPDLVFRLDDRGTYLDVKADHPSILAAPVASLLGRTIGDVLPSAEADGMLQAIRRVIASGVAESFEYRLELQGAAHDFEARIVALAAHEVVLVVRDITERKRAEAAMLQAKDAAEAANQAKSRFLSTMSHELRTPLQAILGYADLLMLENGLAVGQIDDVQSIQRAARQLIAIVDDVLDLSRIEAGRVEVALEPVAARTVVDQVLATVRPLAAAKGLRLVDDLPADLPPVCADPLRLRQILLNLAGNAVKFTEAGAITISACANVSQVAISVADTGIGIDPAALPHIFAEFQQADSSLSRRYGGAGLGLAISNRLAALQGGAIQVESEVGRGSTFTLTLPAFR
jgi:PAS domain S-box-containing protein